MSQNYTSPVIMRSSALDNPTEDDHELLTLTSLATASVRPSYVKIISDNITTNVLSQKIFPLKNDDYTFHTSTFTYSINVLFDVRANQQYTLKAKVIYSDGDFSSYSSMYVFTSAPTVPVILSAFGTSQTSIFLNISPQTEVQVYTAVLTYVDHNSDKQLDVVEGLSASIDRQFIELPNLLESVEYLISIFANNSNGQSYLSNSVSSTTKPQPMPPTNLDVEFDTSAYVSLSWTAPSNSLHLPVEYYIIQDGFGNELHKVAGNSTSYSFPTPHDLNESYTFQIVAENISNGTSFLSIPSTSVTISIPEPGEVQNLHITSIDPSTLLITINWDYPLNHSIIRTTSYNIVKDGNVVQTTGANGFTFNGAPNQTYSFDVVPLHNSHVASSQARSISTQIPLTGSPGNMSANFNSSGDIALSWLVPSNNNVITTTSFNVYDKNGLLVGNKLNNNTAVFSYTVLSQRAGQDYAFYVKSVHGSVEGMSSLTYSFSIPSPSAPRSLAGVINPIGEPTISLSWLAPSNNSTISTDSYNVYQDNSLIYSGSQLNFDTSVLVAGRSYTFVVKPLHGSDEFDNSVSLIITPFQNASAPTNFVAQPKNQSIILSWSDPSNIGGGTPTKYVLSYGSTVLDVPISPGAYSQTISGLTNKTSYNFSLKMITNTNVNGESATLLSAVPSGRPIVNSIVLTAGAVNAYIDNNGSALVDNYILIVYDTSNVPTVSILSMVPDNNGIVHIETPIGMAVKATLIVSNAAGLTTNTVLLT